ncbi:MAG: hypothetical protein D6785_10370, partial [Planctomycetota bacterium]
RTKKIKTPGDIASLVQDGKNFIKDIQKDRRALESEKRKLEQDLQSLDGLESQLQEAIQKDWQNIEKKYNLSKGGNLQLAKLLLGKEVGNKLDAGLEVYQYLTQSFKRKVKKAKKKIIKRQKLDPPVEFPLKLKQPDFILENMDFSFWWKNLKLKGKGRNISSDPEVYGKPGRIEGKYKKNKYWEEGDFGILLDKKQGKDLDSLTIKIKGLNISDISTPLGIQIQKALVNLQGKITVTEGLKLDGKLVCSFDQVKFNKSSQKDELVEMLMESLIDTSFFRAEILVGGTLKEPYFKIQSDLDFKMGESLQKKLKSQNQKFLTLLKGEFKKKTHSSLQDVLGEKKNLFSLKDRMVQE